MWHSAKAMIKTIWKRNAAVEMHPHDEGSSGRSLPVKLTRKMSFSIYGCANASPGARPALRRTQPSSARFLYLHSLTALPAAEGWENRSRDPLEFGFSSDCYPMQAKPRTPSACSPPAGHCSVKWTPLQVPRQHRELPFRRFFLWGHKPKKITPEYIREPKEAFGNPWCSYNYISCQCSTTDDCNRKNLQLLQKIN